MCSLRPGLLGRFRGSSRVGPQKRSSLSSAVGYPIDRPSRGALPKDPALSATLDIVERPHSAHT